MTFGDVPVGHVFKWQGCDCLCRRDGETSYVYVRRCPEHFAAYAASGIATISKVIYDPLIAMLEAQKS